MLDRNEYVRKRASFPVFPGHSLLLLRDAGPCIFSDSYIQMPRHPSEMGNYGTLVVASEEERLNLKQLILLAAAAKRGDGQALDDRMFKKHVTHLLANLGLILAIHDLKSESANWRFSINAVYGATKLTEDADTLAEAVNQQLRIIPPDGCNSNFWRFNLSADHMQLVTAESILQLRAGKPAVVEHEWVDAMSPYQIEHTHLKVGDRYRLEAQVA